MKAVIHKEGPLALPIYGLLLSTLLTVGLTINNLMNAEAHQGFHAPATTTGTSKQTESCGSLPASLVSNLQFDLQIGYPPTCATAKQP